jgi:hypothetical protein
VNFPSIVDGRPGDLGLLPNHRLSLGPNLSRKRLAKIVTSGYSCPWGLPEDFYSLMRSPIIYLPKLATPLSIYAMNAYLRRAGGAEESIFGSEATVIE